MVTTAEPLFSPLGEDALAYFDLLGIPVTVLDGAGRRLAYNRAARILFATCSDVDAAVKRVLFPGGEATVAGEREMDLPLDDGSRLRLHWNLQPWRDESGGLLAVVGVATDLTARYQTEVAMCHDLEQLRGLAARRETVREEERSQLAREVHDELGQALTGMKMDVSWIANRLAGDSLDMEPIRNRITGFTALIEETIGSVRALATRLRPGILDDFGIAAAIEWLAQEFTRRTGVACATEIDHEHFEVDGRVSTAMFRICQEALTNVTRHAAAQQVTISLCAEEAFLVMNVRDDGRGIRPGEIAATGSLGLLGMRERTAMLGGLLNVSAAQAGGTLVQVRLPMQPRDVSGGNNA